MIYLDVTSSCKSPMNTGVQRMVRGLHAALTQHAEVTPMLWSPKLKSYCRLARRERQFLEAPFRRHRAPSAKPERTVVRLPLSATLRHLRYRRNRFALETVAHRDDILLVPEIFQDNRIETFAGHASTFPGRRIAVFHDAIALRLPEFTAPERQRRFPDYIRALAGFDKVVCVSREVEDDLRLFWKSYGVAPAPTRVLGWPTDFGIARPPVRSNFNAARVLCVATLERRKNHLALLEACEKLWSAGVNFALILVGRTTADWGGTVLGRLKQLAKRGRSVRWLRHVNDDALHAAYRDCSFTVYPSLREGFGLPVLESLWHGRPCVCAGTGAIGEAAADGGCRLVDPTGAEALAGALRELLTNATTYDRLFNEARARTFRSWDNYIDELLREIDVA